MTNYEIILYSEVGMNPNRKEFDALITRLRLLKKTQGWLSTTINRGKGFISKYVSDHTKVPKRVTLIAMERVINAEEQKFSGKTGGLGKPVDEANLDTSLNILYDTGYVVVEKKKLEILLAQTLDDATLHMISMLTMTPIQRQGLVTKILNQTLPQES